MKKLPTLNMQDWLDAEAEIYNVNRQRPEGSITVNEYAKVRGTGQRSARECLTKMVEIGKATKIRWKSHDGRPVNVYTLNKKNGK
jgi:hypothetical protein